MNDWSAFHSPRSMLPLMLTLFTLTPVAPTSSNPLTPIGVDGLPKDWVFLIKLGKGGDNCKQVQSPTSHYEDFECGMLYADAQNQTLRQIAGTVHDPTGPLYRTWSQGALDPQVAYQVWNDQSGPTDLPPLGNGISAHDKGFLMFNNDSGILCQHTCPHWLYSSSNHFRSAATFYNHNHPGGDATTYSQTFLLIALKSLTDVNAIRKMIARENAHLFFADFGTVNKKLFPVFTEPNQPVSRTAPAVPIHDLFGSSVSLFAKHRNEHYDYWAYYTDTFCPASKSQVWTYVECGPGILKSANVIDYNCNSRANRYGQGSRFGKSNWYPNHMKVGYCLAEEVVGIAGWNHKASQLLRGSLFAVIRSKQLHDSFSKLFPHSSFS